MNIKYIFLVLFGFILAQSKAQDMITVELIKGSKMEGKIISYTYGDTLLLLVNDKYTIFIPEDAIKKIKFHTDNPYYVFGDKKWLNTTRAVLDLGRTANSFGLNHTFSYRAFTNFYTGIGIGIDNYYTSEEYNVIPIFVSAKYYFLKSGFSPFVDLRAGYGHAVATSNQAISQGGRHINPTFGYRFGNKKLYTELTIGLKFQKLNYEYVSGENTTQYDILVKRFEVGLSFTY